MLRAVARSLAVLVAVAVVTAAVVVLTDRGSPVMIDPTQEGDPPPAAVEETTADPALAAVTPPDPDPDPESEAEPDLGPAADDPGPVPAPGTGPPAGEDGAPPPGRTSVQVLDGGGGAAAVAEVVALAEAAGYEVVAVNAARCCYDATTALWSAGREPAAAGLAAAIDGVVEVRENPNLSQEVDVHVVVGVDWAD